MKNNTRKTAKLAIALNKREDPWKTAAVLFQMAAETLAETQGLDRQTALMLMKYVAKALN
jgi:hypothetical protein